MKCPKCQSENTDTARFCSDCGTNLTPIDEAQPSITKTIETPREELTTGSTFAGRYQIIEELGKGGMGKVYKAVDTRINEKIALKLIKPEVASDKNTLERFGNELKLARKIAHKNVGKMFDINEEQGTHYITMEYVSGQDLKGLIRQTGQLAIGTATSIAKQICEGLTEAHKVGVVHRDLKPNNIMIDREGQVRIMDFGIARSLKEKGITGAGVMIGTPEYMSPEQAEAKEVDQRSDIYSLGVIMYEMVAGRVPFEGDTALSIAMKHKGEIPKDPKEYNAQVPDDLSQLILKCLEKDNKKRYQSSVEIYLELSDIEKGIPTTDRSIPKRKPQTSREITVTFGLRKILVPAFVIIVILITAFVVWRLFLKKETQITSEERALAVLPFENLGSPEEEYFAAGITDEIIARLTNVSDLRVIARNSTIQYKNPTKSISEIGNELGVEYILTGTVRWQKSLKDPSHVRVTPSLIRVADSTQLWAEVYEELITEVFKVQSDISNKVIDALGVVMLEPEQDAIETIPTINMEAYDYYLRGIEYQYRGADEHNIKMSIRNFEKAIDLDQSFYQAYAKLSRVQAFYFWHHIDHSVGQSAKAKEAAEKAFQINPEAPEAHIALGYYYYHCELDYDEALKHFDFALKRQPQNSELLSGIGYVKRRQGRMGEALIYLNKAIELDPRSADLTFNHGVTHVLLRNFREAQRWYDRAIFLNPEFQRAHFHRVRLNLYQGNTKRAREILEEVSRTINSLDPHRIIYCWVLTDIYESKYEDALQRLSSVSIEAFSDQFYFVPVSLLNAVIYSLIEDSQLKKHHYDVSLQFLEEKIRKDPQDSRYYSALGITYAGLNKKAQAIQSAEKAVEILPPSKEIYRGAFRVYDLAQVFAMVGEYDKAFDQIEYLLSIPSEICPGIFRIDPIWDPLEEHPRFKQLVNAGQKN